MTGAVEPAGRHEPRAAPVPPPHSSNSTRVIVALPFSSIRVNDTRGAATVADLVARLCRTLAEGGSPEELERLAADADALAHRLRND